MKLNKEHLWAAIGFTAVAFSAWLLYHQLRDISLADVLASLGAIAPRDWGLAALATAAAYAGLALYDRVALLHLRKRVSWRFIVLCSFTAYALAHNIGASVVSGAIVRYRAYSSRGLSAGDVGLLVAFCSFTFALAVALLAGVVLLADPGLLARFYPEAPAWLAQLAGTGLLSLVGLYVLGSALGCRPLRLGRFELRYPRLPVVLRQLVVGPLEVMGAAAIIYVALPDAGNPGYLAVLGIFLASFSAGLIAHAPGGLGVLEVVFLLALPEAPAADVIAALLVFRLFYLLVPFALSLPVVLLFERAQLRRAAVERAETLGLGCTPLSGPEADSRAA